MYPRQPARSRHDDPYRPPTNLAAAFAVAAAVPLALFALLHPAFLVGAVAGAVATAALAR
ncbi:hypothetical protein [Halobaculum lipolyticum]|uniref:Uncharacterized protein n=1 Tax=Halobaculum lipolyticum TaxID=3032001 RepID=A0ABD5WBM0_9EURY|nr:hypothetical protein [Halobaculum sp. DT31]